MRPRQISPGKLRGENSLLRGNETEFAGGINEELGIGFSDLTAEAATVFNRLLKERGDSKLVPDAAYKIGEAFFALGRCDKSDLFLKTVASQYKKRRDLVKQANATLAKTCTPAS